MNKKCKHCLGKGYRYDVANMIKVLCPYCSHVKIEDTKVESHKPERVVSREGENIKHIKTLRDEFAMAFPHLSDEQLDDEIEVGESPIECQARLSYQYADAMMKEREK